LTPGSSLPSGLVPSKSGRQAGVEPTSLPPPKTKTESKRFYFPSLTFEASAPSSHHGCFQVLPISAPCCSQTCCTRALSSATSRGFFGCCPCSREKKDGGKEKKRAEALPPPPSTICFPGLRLGCFHRGTAGRCGKGLVLFGWGRVENQSSVRANSPHYP